MDINNMDFLNNDYSVEDICDIMSQLSPIDRVHAYESMQEYIMDPESSNITSRDIEKRDAILKCLNAYEALAVGNGVENLAPFMSQVLAAEDQVDDYWFFKVIRKAFGSIDPSSVKRFNSNPQVELWPNMMDQNQKVQFESLHFWFSPDDEVVFNFKNGLKITRRYCDREDWAFEKAESFTLF